MSRLGIGLHRARLSARQAAARLTRKRAIRAYFDSHAVRKLHVGCGPSLLEGWLNTDFDPPRGGVYLDAAQPFPVADGVFDYLFSEHLIEHLPYTTGRSMLSECRRVLRPGGRIRVATPDLQRLASLTAGGGAAERYVRWVVERFAPYADRPRPAFAINVLFHDFGHSFLYDRETLAGALEESGFVDVTAYEPGASDDPELRQLEGRGRRAEDLEMVQFETLVLEAARR